MTTTGSVCIQLVVACPGKKQGKEDRQRRADGAFREHEEGFCCATIQGMMCQQSLPRVYMGMNGTSRNGEL